MTSFLSSKWPRAFFLVTAVQALICLAFEAYTFAKFQLSLNGSPAQNNPNITSQLRTIPTFLTLFIFAFLYELVVVWDALRMKNTIQVIGVCIASLAILVYTAIQIEQIHNALDILQAGGAMLNDRDVWTDVRGYLIAIPVIIALTTIILSFLAWKLYREFAWDILKAIGADYRMKQRFFYYQIYIALLKFDFFFFLGFTVQFLVVVTGKTDVELYLTIAAIPVTILILLGAAYSAYNELRGGMIATMVLYFGGLSWFIFKLVRIYQPSTRKEYQAVQKSLTAFAVVTILLIVLTIANAVIVMMNFGKGLKNHIKASKGRDEEKPDLNSISMNDVKPQLPSRMTID